MVHESILEGYPEEIMFTVLARLSIEEYQKFIGVFATQGLEKRRQHGCQRTQVYKREDDPGQVFILLEWKSQESFDAFRQDPEVPGVMKSGGALAPPEFTVLEKTAEFPG